MQRKPQLLPAGFWGSRLKRQPGLHWLAQTLALLFHWQGYYYLTSSAPPATATTALLGHNSIARSGEYQMMQDLAYLRAAQPCTVAEQKFI